MEMKIIGLLVGGSLIIFNVIFTRKNVQDTLKTFLDNTVTNHAVRIQKYCMERWRFLIHFGNKSYAHTTTRFLVFIDKENNSPVAVPIEKLYLKDEKDRFIAAVNPETVYKAKIRDGKMETVVFGKRDIVADRKEKIAKVLYVKPTKPKITVSYGQHRRVPWNVSEDEFKTIQTMCKECTLLWMIDDSQKQTPKQERVKEKLITPGSKFLTSGKKYL